MKNLTKRAASLLLALCLLAGLSLPAASGAEAEVTISSVEELETFAKNCSLDAWSRDVTVRLTADLDLANREFAPIPTFGGTFLGEGHTIKNLRIIAAGSNAGLFRYLQEGAVVQDLYVYGSVHPSGSAVNVGGIVGQAEPDIALSPDSGTLDRLCRELDTLENLISRALNRSEGNRNDISARLSGMGLTTGEARDHTQDRLDHLADFTDENIGSVNSLSAAATKALEDLTPALEELSGVSGRIEGLADSLEDALDALGNAAGAGENVSDDADRAAGIFRRAGESLSAAVRDLRAAVSALQSAVVIRDRAAVDAAASNLSASLEDFGTAADQFGQSMDALQDALGSLGGLSGQLGDTLGRLADAASLAGPVGRGLERAFRILKTVTGNLAEDGPTQFTPLGEASRKAGRGLFDALTDLSVIGLPPAPEREGSYGEWPAFDTSGLRSDVLVEAVYTPWITLVASGEQDGDLALALAEGQFTKEAALHVQPNPFGTSEIVYAWDVTLTGTDLGPEAEVPLRLLNRTGGKAEVRQYRDGRWVPLPAKTNGSYLLVTMEGAGGSFQIVPAQENGALPVLLAALGLFLALLIIYHNKKKKAAAKTAAAPAK